MICDEVIYFIYIYIVCFFLARSIRVLELEFIPRWIWNDSNRINRICMQKRFTNELFGADTKKFSIVIVGFRYGYKLAARAQLLEVVLGGEQAIEVDPPAIEEGVISNSFTKKLGRKKRVEFDVGIARRRGDIPPKFFYPRSNI